MLFYHEPMNPNIDTIIYIYRQKPSKKRMIEIKQIHNYRKGYGFSPYQKVNRYENLNHVDICYILIKYRRNNDHNTLEYVEISFKNRLEKTKHTLTSQPNYDYAFIYKDLSILDPLFLCQHIHQIKAKNIRIPLFTVPPWFTQTIYKKLMQSYLEKIYKKHLEFEDQVHQLIFEITINQKIYNILS